jgi:hypothetical protein
LRVIIVVVQVGAVKIYVAAVEEEEELRKKERGYETQFTTKIGWKKTSLGLSYFRFFCKISFPVVTYLMPYYAETQFTTKIGWKKTSLGLSYFVFW